MGPRKGKDVQEFLHEGVTYKAGDTCMFNPEDENSLPYVGRIDSAQYQSSDPEDIQLNVTWYYRPEEAEGGRKVFHGSRELLHSDHSDSVNKDSLICKARIHSLKDFEALDAVGDMDYFVRFNYKVATREVVPDKIPVYCTCETPYNPDRWMVQCSGCQEWYHAACVGISDTTCQDTCKSFSCPACKIASVRGQGRAVKGTAKRQQPAGRDSSAAKHR